MNANIFSLLDSDDEGAKPAVPKKEVVEKKPAKEAAAPKTENREGQRGGRGGRGGRGRGPRPNRDRFPRERDAAPAIEGEEKEKREPRHDGPRRERRGREFDRHSGTGRGREMKKGGAGKANWGKDEEAPTDENAAAPAPETPVENVEAEVAEVVEHVEEEEEDTTMTLQEYLAKRTQSSFSGEAFEKRDLREVDEAAFAGAKKISKDGKTPDFVEAQYERVNREKKSGRKKVLLEDVGFRAGGQEDRRERGGRGGRGRGEGGRGEGGRGGRSSYGRGGRGPRPSKGSTPLNVADTNDFPALS